MKQLVNPIKDLPPTLLTLVTGPSALKREEAIWWSIEIEAAASLQYPQRMIAVILEGLLPDGKTKSCPTNININVKRVAPGCFCCVGLLTLRVTLNRLLRKHPDRLYVSIADATHVQQIRAILTSEPYDEWLTISNQIDT